MRDSGRCLVRHKHKVRPTPSRQAFPAFVLYPTVRWPCPRRIATNTQIEYTKEDTMRERGRERERDLSTVPKTPPTARELSRNIPRYRLTRTSENGAKCYFLAHLYT